MKALPAAMATGCIHSGTMAGKLNGVMPATTPSGWRRVCTSTPVEASALNSLLDAWLIPQTNSIVSRPRAISPRASSTVLPCSLEITSASSCSCVTMSSRMRNRIMVRLASEVRPHVFCASVATRTASSTVVASPTSSWALTSPLDGL